MRHGPGRNTNDRCSTTPGGTVRTQVTDALQLLGGQSARVLSVATTEAPPAPVSSQVSASPTCHDVLPMCKAPEGPAPRNKKSDKRSYDTPISTAFAQQSCISRKRPVGSFTMPCSRVQMPGALSVVADIAVSERRARQYLRLGRIACPERGRQFRV